MAIPVVSISDFTPVIGEPVDFGQAISLNGNSPIKLADSFTGTGEVNTVVEIFQDSTNFSVLGWIEPSSLEGDKANILYTERSGGKFPFLVLKITDSGNLNVTLNSGDGLTTESFDLGNGEITAGNWSSIAVTFDKGVFTYYVDGKKYEGSVIGSTLIPAATGNTALSERTLIIGGDAGGNNNYEGQLDELSFWNTTLSETEIQQFLYDTRPTGSETGLVAYYTFDDDEVNSGANNITIRDLVNGDNIGTLPGDSFRTTNNNGRLSANGGTSVPSNIPNFIGYVDITLDTPVESELGAIVRYELNTIRYNFAN